MARVDAILNFLNDLTNEDVFEIHNHYCDVNSDYDSRVYGMDEFDDLFDNSRPSEIAESIYCGSFCPRDNYFSCGTYLESFDNWDDGDSPVDIDAIAKHIDEEDDDLGNADVREFLDTYVEEDEK